MRKAILVLFLIALSLTSIAWLPITGGIAPRLQDILTEIRKMPDDPGYYAEFRDDFWEFNTGIWDSTSVVVDAGGAVATVDSLQYPGVLKISAGQASKGILNGINVQTNQAPFYCAPVTRSDSATVPLEFEIKMMVKNATQMEFRAGLTIEDEVLTTGQTYGIFFVKHDNSTALRGKEIKANEAATDSTASLATLSNSTWYKLKIAWSGNAARFYVDDVLKATLSTAANRPTGVKLKPTFEFASGDSTVQYAYVDYVWVKQRR
jgi:hypothetical protein